MTAPHHTSQHAWARAQRLTRAAADRARRPSGHAQSLVLSVALLLAGWSGLHLGRASYTVTGTIRDVVESTYPWSLGRRFDLVVQLETGKWLRFQSLRGSCDRPVRLSSPCTKREFPVGSAIALDVSGFVDPNACPDVGRYLRDFSCSWRITPRHTYVDAVKVDGRPLTTGWSPNSSALAPDLFIAALSILLAWHGWRFSSIRTRTIYAFGFMCGVCFLAPNLYL